MTMQAKERQEFAEFLHFILDNSGCTPTELFKRKANYICETDTPEEGASLYCSDFTTPISNALMEIAGSIDTLTYIEHIKNFANSTKNYMSPSIERYLLGFNGNKIDDYQSMKNTLKHHKIDEVYDAIYVLDISTKNIVKHIYKYTYNDYIGDVIITLTKIK